MKKKRFTLIELLIVVAIVAILAAILRPALLRAKHEARKVLCTANLKQQGIGAIMYVDDHGGKIQILQSHHPNQVKRPSIDNREYLRKITNNSPEVLYCPLAETFTMDSRMGWNNADADGWAFMSYNIVGFYDDSFTPRRPHFFLKDVFDYQVNTGAGRYTTNVPKMIGEIEAELENIRQEWADIDYETDVLWLSSEKISEPMRVLLKKGLIREMQKVNPSHIDVTESFSRCPSGYHVMMVAGTEKTPNLEGWMMMEQGCSDEPLGRFRINQELKRCEAKVSDLVGYIPVRDYLALLKQANS